MKGLKASLLQHKLNVFYTKKINMNNTKKMCNKLVHDFNASLVLAITAS